MTQFSAQALCTLHQRVGERGPEQHQAGVSGQPPRPHQYTRDRPKGPRVHRQNSEAGGPEGARD